LPNLGARFAALISLRRDFAALNMRFLSFAGLVEVFVAVLVILTRLELDGFGTKKALRSGESGGLLRGVSQILLKLLGGFPVVGLVFR